MTSNHCKICNKTLELNMDYDKHNHDEIMYKSNTKINECHDKDSALSDIIIKR